MDNVNYTNLAINLCGFFTVKDFLQKNTQSSPIHVTFSVKSILAARIRHVSQKYHFNATCGRS